MKQIKIFTIFLLLLIEHVGIPVGVYLLTNSITIAILSLVGVVMSAFAVQAIVKNVSGGDDEKEKS